MEPLFLTYDEVVAINVDQIERYGGLSGVREEGLLLSALAMPQAGFGEVYAHADLYEMAAAYLFHIVNIIRSWTATKRTGAVAARIFLVLNGIVVTMPEDVIYNLVIAIAEGRAEKPEIAASFRSHSRGA